MLDALGPYVLLGLDFLMKMMKEIMLMLMKGKLLTLIHGLLENPMGKEMKTVQFPTDLVHSGMMHHVTTLYLHFVELKRPPDYI